MTYSFFATLSRMKYIQRWQLMRSARPEYLSEHSLEVAMIAHALAVIANLRYGRGFDEGRAALIGIFHDASEIMTGDMPTPVKYYNEEFREAYRAVEKVAERHLVARLPLDMQSVYADILGVELPDGGGRGLEEDEGREAYLRRLVKAADRISALIKCMEEENAGNGEFRSAAASTRQSVEKLAEELPEVRDFLTDFLPPYGSTLDELSQ